MTADQIISALNLALHLEGGHYRETWRAPATDDARGAGSAIYYLLYRHMTQLPHRSTGGPEPAGCAPRADTRP